MNWFVGQVKKIIFIDGSRTEDGKPSRYRQMWQRTVLAVAAVSLIPLVSITSVNYFLYRRSTQKELLQPFQSIASVTKLSLESFIEERIAAAKYVSSREQPEDLFNKDNLTRIFARMKHSFGGIVDIGVIDSSGIMRTYEGPYELTGKDYRDQDWFGKVLVRDVYVSDIFLGHRNLPHFVIAVNRESERGEPIIFRATIDTEGLVQKIQIAGHIQASDVFLLNREGILQTPSSMFGEAFQKFPGRIPQYAEGSQLIEDMKIGDRSYIMGYSFIKESPFLFAIIANREDILAGWQTYKKEMFAFLALSIIAILVIIMGITSGWVERIRQADLRREASLHNIEHTNRMASIGRLAAGVAHEINNPLAIINEKAGLIKDLLGMPKENPPDRERLLKQTNAIIQSVTRCSEITHRLLGFARHIDIKIEPVAIDALIRDVLGFLEKEADYRDIHIDMQVADALPTVHSDRGQLQQLFLNLINNAFDAMKKGGRLEISVGDKAPNHVIVKIKDDGIGIARKDIEHIFEPFFSTKKSKGTGLGLSISYGIVKKLRGTIYVESELGEGTTFTVTLPVERPV
ncbi:MAG: two-component sensor histidine kinase [Acidobacteria bacterium]|nr:two-component sensor histidine kinase [Acidobacteriota bacterium]